MVSPVLVAIAAAVLAWPRPGRSAAAVLEICRGRAMIGPSGEGTRGHSPLTRLHRAARRGLGTATVAAVAAAAGLLVAGPAGAVSAAGLAATVWARGMLRRRAQARIAAGGELAAGLELMISDLRSGAPPGRAAAAAAAELDGERVGDGSEPAAAAALRLTARTTALGGDVPSALRAQLQRWPALREPLPRLIAAWELSQRHGLPLAELLSAVAADLEHRQRFSTALQARMAGPRSTAMVLAGLPIVGLLLGESMGARPWHVLADTLAGQLLLALGIGLICAGLWWAERLTSAVIA